MSGDGDRKRLVDSGQLLDRDRIGQRVGSGAAPFGGDGDAHQAELGGGRHQIQRKPPSPVEFFGHRSDRSLCELANRPLEETVLVGEVVAQHSDSASSTSSRTPKPVPPRANSSPRGRARSAVPAMSRCAHGPSPANSCRKRAGVRRARHAEARRVAHVGDVRTDEARDTFRAGEAAKDGRRSARRLRPAGRSSSWSRPITPAWRSPSATTTAPVSVARSTRWVAPSVRAWWRQSASTSRPSASVFEISIVLPFLAVTTSPTFTELESTMFSVAPATVITLIGSPSSAIAAVGLEHRGGARHVVLHTDHAAGRLHRQPAGVERDALADQAEHDIPAAGTGRPVAHRDQPGGRAVGLGDGGERAHAVGLDPALVAHLGGDSAVLAGDRPGPVGQLGRPHVPGRSVLQVAGAADRVGDRRGALDGRPVAAHDCQQIAGVLPDPWLLGCDSDRSGRPRWTRPRPRTGWPRRHRTEASRLRTRAGERGPRVPTVQLRRPPAWPDRRRRRRPCRGRPPPPAAPARPRPRCAAPSPGPALPGSRRRRPARRSGRRGHDPAPRPRPRPSPAVVTATANMSPGVDSSVVRVAVIRMSPRCREQSAVHPNDTTA